MDTTFLWIACANLFLLPTVAEVQLRRAASPSSHAVALKLSFVFRLILGFGFLIGIGALSGLGLDTWKQRCLQLAVLCFGALLLGGLMVYSGKKLSQKPMLSLGVLQLASTVLVTVYFLFALPSWTQ